MNNLMKIAKDAKWRIAVLVTIVMFFVVWNSPLTVDDLYFKGYKLHKFRDILKFAAYYGNGRLLGNILIHYIIKSLILRALIQSLGLVVLILLVYRVVQTKHIELFVLETALIIVVSPAIFRDDYLWSSAFANYMPGIIAMLLAYIIVREKDGGVWKLILCIIAINGQLFVEHTSLIKVFFSFCLVVYYKTVNKDKGKLIKSIMWLVSTSIGMFIMLMIPRIYYISNEWEDYQKTNFGSIHDLLVSIISNGILISRVYLQSSIALIVLSTVIIIIIKPNIISQIILTLVPIYGILRSLFSNDNWNSSNKEAIILLIVLMYFLTVFVSLVSAKKLGGKK